MKHILLALAASALTICATQSSAWQAQSAARQTPAKCQGYLQEIAGENAPAQSPINQVLFSKLMLQYTNYFRCDGGLPPLKDTPDFQSMSLVHSDWMAATDTLSHESTKPGWRHLGDRLKNSGMKYRSGRENVAMIPMPDVKANEPFRYTNLASCRIVRSNGKPIARRTYRQLAVYTTSNFMMSPGHRASMMATDVTHHTAVSRTSFRKETCGLHYITQNFIGDPSRK